MNKNEEQQEINRRDFLRNTSQAAFLAMMAGVGCHAQDKPDTAAAANALTKAPPIDTINFGVIGAGLWGREIITTLGQLINEPPQSNPYAPVVAICDHYEKGWPKLKNSAPDAKLYSDYKELLADPKVEAVVIATPTHQHRQIVVDALAKGKHVYCEAPLANSIDDAKAIASEAKNSFRSVFQAGLQERSHPQRHFLWPFIHARNLGANVMARVQWHKKTSWAQENTDPKRTAELNWRLQRATSTGLIGENCIHLLDAATWFMRARPTEVTGFSSMILWGGDGRDVPDTVQAVFEMPDGSRLICDATLCNSFDAQYEMYYGADNSIMVRDSKAWMFQEPDAPNVGWVVYCRKDVFGRELGVALEANGSKQKALLKDAVVAPAFPNPPIYYALQNFAYNAGQKRESVAEFNSLYPGSIPKPDDLAIQHPKPAAGWKEGLEATVLAIKANEAAVAKTKITLDKEFFELL